MRNFRNTINLNAFEHFIEFSCFTDQFLTGMDMLGDVSDLKNDSDFEGCELYKSIRKVEQLKHSIDAEYRKHVSVVKNIFKDNIKVNHDLNLYGIINFDLDSWIEHVKMFYINLLSNADIYNEISNHGMQLEEIETAIELMIELEENSLKISKQENEYLN